METEPPLLPTGRRIAAQTVHRRPTPLVAIENEAPPLLFVDPPLAGPLAHGRVSIRYRTENLGVAPMFGQGALDVSPRIVMSTSPSTTHPGILSM